jgi:hypothetical protein
MADLREQPAQQAVFAVNGGFIPYPTRMVDPYIEHMKRGGVSLDYHPQPNAGHSTAWWPDEGHLRDVRARHPRQPLPDTLTWEMGNSAGFNRAHRLVTTARRAEERREVVADLNDMPMPTSADFGAQRHAINARRLDRMRSGLA